MKLSGLKYLADQGTENIWKNKMMAFATFCVLLISLILVGMSVLFYINMNSMILGLNDQNEIVVIMKQEVTEDDLDSAEAAINELDNINTVEFRSKEYALEHVTAGNSSTQYLIQNGYITDAEFMPYAFSVTVKDMDKIAETSDKLAAIQGVDYVQSSFQVAEFLRELRRVVTLIAGAVIIALSIVSMIMISNTTKASVFSRREEIQIMKYVGATNGFIRIPFFIEGMVTGFFSGVGSFFITWWVYRTVYNVLMEKQYIMDVFGIDSLIPFKNIRIVVLIAYLVAGSLIGAIGSVISTRKHIDV